MTRHEHELRRRMFSEASKKMKLTHHDRPVPPDWRKSITLNYFRKFTWLQRLQIFLGYSLRIEVQFLTVNSPGKVASKLTIVTTKNINPQQELADELVG